MAGYVIDLPPGVEANSSHMTALLNIANGATDTAVARNSQPPEAPDPASGALRASSSHDTEMEGAFGVTDSSRGRSHDPIGEEDGGALFKPFKHLPGEIRTAIWISAADAAKPQGVYRFKVQDIKLGLALDHYPLAPTMFTNIRRLDSDNPLVHEIRDMMQSVYRGDSISAFTPLPEVGRFTCEIRDLLRSCPEARSELIRNPAFGSSFNFHWVDGEKRCDLGVIRPFCYDTDWVSLSEITHYPTIRLAEPGVHCTLDITKIQHVAIPYDVCYGLHNFERIEKYLRTLAVFISLKSLGIYEPSFTVKKASHWNALITHEERLFLKGVPTSASRTRTRSGRRLNCRSFQRAMIELRKLIQDTAIMVIMKTTENWNPIYRYVDYAGLQFCFLLHADSQAGLDIMEFKEDGSHLDDIARIEDLGPLGWEMKALQIHGS
ncbi:hypothetical protein UCDDA912_g02925 [Diaporthe ampelina]|uniref:Uncharacterized protein n=1 Tax=Diaporthe ampelina TaxID=1214573 RepID=A0A0G2HQB7_9PEZI|nr:hypothetical protein UCDDA912_g02925 [Diaporthe ampelina]